MSEALAFREVYLIIATRKLVNVCICGDNLNLVSLSSNENVPPWEASHIIHDIWCLAKQWNISFCFVNRERNIVAYWVAS